MKHHVRMPDPILCCRRCRRNAVQKKQAQSLSTFSPGKRVTATYQASSVIPVKYEAQLGAFVVRRPSETLD